MSLCVCVSVFVRARARARARLVLTLEPAVPCAWALDNRDILVSSWDMSSVDDSGHGAIQPISKEPNLTSRDEDTRDDLKAEVSEAPKSDAVRPDTRSDVSTVTTVSVA